MSTQVSNQPYTGQGFTLGNSNLSGFGTDCLLIGHATYNFSIDGGAISTITPQTNFILPTGALCTRAWVHSPTAPVGTGATVAVGLTTGTGGSTTTILGATAITSLTANAILVSGLGAAPFKTTGSSVLGKGNNGAVTVTIATTALTAGQLEIWVEYILSPA